MKEKKSQNKYSKGASVTPMKLKKGARKGLCESRRKSIVKEQMHNSGMKY